MCVSDENLARAAAEGDREGFATLLARHYDRLFALAFKLCGDRAEAEDITQDICLALPGKLAGFRQEARFTTWLYRVVVNAVHDRRRRNASRSRAGDGWGDWELSRRAEADEADAAQDWLIQAMNTLPPDLRDTLVLILDDCTQKETGEILGVSEGTIAWRVSEAKKKLRQMAESDAI